MNAGDEVAGPGWAVLESARVDLHVAFETLWIGYFSVGGNGSVGDVREWLAGRGSLDRSDYNFLAQALNDESIGRGLDHPVPYRDPTG